MTCNLHGACMNRITLLIFFAAVLVAFALLWTAESLFPKSAASAVVLVFITLLGASVARPGWHLRPRWREESWLPCFGGLFISAAGAAWFLAWLKVPLPYDFSTLNLVTAAPAILIITGIEELLFRQVMYRWLEQRGLSEWTIIVATALAFGWAHLGPVFIGSQIGVTFYLLQSAYMIWIGGLLGSIRRATQSWAMSWLGHFCYNVSVLYFLMSARTYT